MKTIKDLSNLQGRWAIVTGATGNLGKVIADSLAELGANLILVDQHGANFNSLQDSLKTKWETEAISIQCNLENEDERCSLINTIKSYDINISILINNAAFVGASDLSGWSVKFEEQSLDTWRRAIEVNLTSVFHLSQAFTPELRIGEGANIINIASIHGGYGPVWDLYEGTSMSNPAAYASSKGGIIQLTRWLSTTLAPQVRVNAISPGGIFRNQPEVFVERYIDRTPLGRMAEEDDFRGVISFLASDMSKYVTGQNLYVDGGWGVW